MNTKITVAMMRNILSQIGEGHDSKVIAVLINSPRKGDQIVYLAHDDVAVQGDRVLIGAI